MKKRVLHIDQNHPQLMQGLAALGFENTEAYQDSLESIQEELKHYHGLILRSRIPVNSDLLSYAPQLEFIGRVGSGLENIDLKAAASRKIAVFAAPEGNCNAVGEHALGLLLGLLNKLPSGQSSIAQGQWLREAHRGWELGSRTVGIIGYGHTGKSFAQKLQGFGCTVYCHDILPKMGDSGARQVSLETIQKKCDVLSFHLPQGEDTRYYFNEAFVNRMKHPFWLLNTSRGSVVHTQSLLQGLASAKILGAGLDVLEFENASFSKVGSNKQLPELEALIQNPNVILSPHVAGWTYESHERLAQTLVDKIQNFYTLPN